MTKDIQKLADEKFEKVKGIVRDSDSQITDYDNDYGKFNLKSKSMGGTTVQVNFKAFPNVLSGDVKVKYEIIVDGEEKINRTTSVAGLDLFILTYRAKIDTIDNKDFEDFEGGLI